MLDLGFSMQAELRTDSTAAKGLHWAENGWLDRVMLRHNASTAPPTHDMVCRV